MADPSKIIILYASAGHGHAKAAKAIAEAARLKGCEVRCVDSLHFTRYGFGARYEALYLFMIRYTPFLWGAAYAMTDVRWVDAMIRPFRRWVNGFFGRTLEEWLVREDPEVVISTHFLGSEVVASLKRRGRLRSKLITVITDYLSHRFWEMDETDAYCVATAETLTQLKSRGVQAERVHITGIPVDPKFSVSIDREAIRASLGIKPKEFCVLVAGGGGGVGLLEPLVREFLKLEPSGQILALCGTNKALYERLLRLAEDRKNVRPFGFIENVHELMSACDIVSGKGGGLMITESLCVGRPMILIGAVPGQETRNVRTMVTLGAAKLAASPERARQQIQVFRRNSELYREAARAIGDIRRPHAARSVWELAHGA